MTPLLYTVPQAAELLQISRSKMYEMIAAGEIESIKLGGCRRVPADVLDDLVESLRG